MSGGIDDSSFSQICDESNIISTEKSQILPKTIVFIIPAFNEERVISKTIHSIRKSTNSLNSKVKIIVIDDGSTDNTANVARSNGANVVYSHMQNRNVAGAFQSAIRLAKRYNPDIVCNFDADGQFNAEEIERVLMPIILGKADLVVGSRFLVNNHIPPLKKVGNKLFSYLLSNISRCKITDASSGFRAFSKEALMHLEPLGIFTYTHESILDVLSARLTYTEVPISVRYFAHRKSRVVKSVFRYTLKSIGVIIMKLIQLRQR